MKNILFYFSGTGNSLTVARELATQLGDCELVAIGGTMHKQLDFSYERVGIIFPVYYWCLPPIVERFVESLRFDESQYVFGVATFAGACGTSLAQLEKAVAKSGGTLSAGFTMGMPGNYVVKYGAFPAALQKWILGGTQKKAARMVRLIETKTPTKIPSGDIMARKTEQQNLKSTEGFKDMGANFHATDKCTGCGTCAKICPVGNISISEKRPHWGSACEQCVACIQWCPAQAIEYGDVTQKRTRYHHPQITLRDMLAE